MGKKNKTKQWLGRSLTPGERQEGWGDWGALGSPIVDMVMPPDLSPWGRDEVVPRGPLQLRR